MNAAETGKVYKIRARTHILRLMGEELIGDDGLAVFELVKNGYDADATSVTVDLIVRPGPAQSITVSDTGTGMTLDDITGKWLELATDSKRREPTIRTKKFRRRVLRSVGGLSSPDNAAASGIREKCPSQCGHYVKFAAPGGTSAGVHRVILDLPMTNTRRSSVCSGLLSGPSRPDSDAPEPPGTVNERNDEDVFIRDLIDEAIRFHEQLSNGLVFKFRHGLPAPCEISERGGSFTSFLNKRCRVEF